MYNGTVRGGLGDATHAATDHCWHLTVFFFHGRCLSGRGEERVNANELTSGSLVLNLVIQVPCTKFSTGIFNMSIFDMTNFQHLKIRTLL